MKEIKIKGDTVELFKILKFEAIASSGGEAKALISAGEVHVNGEKVLAKRRKIVAGDEIEVFGERFRVERAAERKI
ncbi:MAG: RNA-binding S4 domain-containing protein [Pseudomonadota bacterium]